MLKPYSLQWGKKRDDIGQGKETGMEAWGHAEVSV